MRATLRPYVSAGVALVGASAIAVAPIPATPPDVKIPNPAVQLTARPFDAYLEALKRVRNSIENLFLQALADPASPITVEDLLDSLLADPAANFQQFVDEIEALGPFLQLNLPIVLGDVADNVQNAIDSAAGGDIDLVVVDLILASFSLAQLEPAVLSIPLDVLGPDLVRVTTVGLVKSLNAATGPVIRGIGKTGVAIQNIINALNEDPDRGALLAVLIGAPGTDRGRRAQRFRPCAQPDSVPGDSYSRRCC